MKGYDYALIAGMICTTSAAFWFQQRYYKLVDDLVVAFVDTEDRYHELLSAALDKIEDK